MKGVHTMSKTNDFESELLRLTSQMNREELLNLLFYDPQMYYGKYDRSPRPQRIVKKTDRGCVVSKAEIGKATKDRYDYAYYLITYKKPVTKTTSSTKKTTTVAKKTAMYCNTTAGLRFRTQPSTSALLVAGANSGKSVIGYGDEVEIVKNHQLSI